MNSFLKENWALLVALTLPLVFAAFFMITKSVQGITVAPPAYDFLIKKTNYNGNLDFVVINGKLNAQFTYPVLHNDTPLMLDNTPELYRISAKNMAAERMHVDLPADANYPPKGKQGTKINLPVGAEQDRLLEPSSVSPDGFELESTYYGQGGNLMTEIFAANRRNSAYSLALVKSGNSFPIRGLKDNYGFEIVGWVVQDNDHAATPPTATQESE